MIKVIDTIVLLSAL